MAKDNIVVVIDPGHGGTNEGALWNDFVEKEITLKVAKAMKEELDKYEGITAYLTREEDKELSLKQRIDIADDYGADFVYCLHFNMSEEHTLYGAECWVSAYDSCYSRAYDFSRIEMEALTNLGLFDRGIKTRISKKGDQDYYGIIRCGKEKNIPTVIIEHCHLDHENDEAFINQDTWLEAYGRLDATSVAKYYGLKSEILGVDYSGFNYEETPVPKTPMYPDTTPPEILSVTMSEIDEYTGDVDITIEAKDDETGIMYYTYSLDGGEHYATYLPWPKGEESVNFTITIPENQECNIIFSVENLYNLPAYYDEIHIEAFEYKKIEAEEPEEIIEAIDEEPEILFTEVKVESRPKNHIDKYAAFAISEIILLAALLTVAFMMIVKINKRRRKR